MSTQTQPSPATTDQASAKEGSRWTSGPAIVAYIAAAKLLLHLFTASNYGYFRDELYFLAASARLDWGYVDMAPMIAWTTWLMRYLLGESLFALHFLPTVAGALKVVLAGLIARQLGGRRFAQALASTAVLAAPGYLAIDSLNTMNALEPLFWIGAAYCVILAIQRDEPRWWVVFGLLAGLGLENKHSTLFFGFGVFVGLLLTPARRFFRGQWLWIAGGIALLLFLPNLIWEWRHHWATLELLNRVRLSDKNVKLGPLTFWAAQVLWMHPLSAPIWLAGLWFFFFSERGRPYRLLGWTFVVVAAMMMALNGKVYYMAPIYPILLAAGAVWIEEKMEARPRLQWLQPASLVLLIVAVLPAVPLVLPVMPPAELVAYMRRLHFAPPKTETHHEGALPQHFGDRFGWPEMVAAVARAYHALPPEERARTGILAGNYGEAGAIDFFGPRYGLPKAVSGHQNYWVWGPPDPQPRNFITLQIPRETLERRCQSVEVVVAILDHPYAMAEERQPVYLCRGFKLSLKEAWPRWKHWN